MSRRAPHRSALREIPLLRDLCLPKPRELLRPQLSARGEFCARASASRTPVLPRRRAITCSAGTVDAHMPARRAVSRGVAPAATVVPRGSCRISDAQPASARRSTPASIFGEGSALSRYPIATDIDRGDRREVPARSARRRCARCSICRSWPSFKALFDRATRSARCARIAARRAVQGPGRRRSSRPLISRAELVNVQAGQADRRAGRRRATRSTWCAAAT